MFLGLCDVNTDDNDECTIYPEKNALDGWKRLNNVVLWRVGIRVFPLRRSALPSNRELGTPCVGDKCGTISTMRVGLPPKKTN